MKTGFGWIKTKVASVVTWIRGLPQAIWEKMKNLASDIASALKEKLPSWLGGGTKQDFISRPGQAPVSFSPQDTIIGTKNPGEISGTKTFNFYGVTPQEIIDVLRREFGVGVNTSSRFLRWQM